MRFNGTIVTTPDNTIVNTEKQDVLPKIQVYHLIKSHKYRENAAKAWELSL